MSLGNTVLQPFYFSCSCSSLAPVLNLLNFTLVLSGVCGRVVIIIIIIIIIIISHCFSHSLPVSLYSALSYLSSVVLLQPAIILNANSSFWPATLLSLIVVSHICLSLDTLIECGLNGKVKDKLALRAPRGHVVSGSMVPLILVLDTRLGDRSALRFTALLQWKESAVPTK
jgi:hypothetical protein